MPDYPVRPTPMTYYPEDDRDEDTDRTYEINMARNDRPSLPEDAPWFSPEEEAREDELGAEYGDARRCPRHPGVKTSSDDGMFDCDCYKCEGEAEEEEEAYQQAQFEFLHPIETAIQRVESMAYAARRERERAERAAADDDICF